MKNIRYQIKVTLKGIRPPIWRRLLLPADCTMDALHCAIQTSMGWCDEHLYAFRTQNRRIEIPDPDGMWDSSWSNSPKPEDSAAIRFSDVAKTGDKITYEYDFGDGWEHTILIEKTIKTDDISARKAECLKGKRACPPEDCGGPWGYQNLLEILAMPEHKRGENEKEFAAWIGHNWDAEDFDLNEVNQALSKWKLDQNSYMYEGICG
ncbi:MAG: plasmid pRiA4b ORF-3 family protein [Mariprofundus sp.]|nr:plasmid pRiA4b ORF-3 family protein [Mariprofundus sp.]